MHKISPPVTATLAPVHRGAEAQPVLVWDIIPDPCNPTKAAISNPGASGWEVVVSASRLTF